MPTSDTIKFVYDGKIVQVKNPDTNQTLLDFIRTNLNKRGSKSGCDEAACGACMVVIGTYIPEKNNIQYHFSQKYSFQLLPYTRHMPLHHIQTCCRAYLNLSL